MFSEEQIAEIIEAEKTAKKKNELKRLQALRLCAVNKMTSKEIAELVKYHPATIDSIVSRYFSKGIDAIVGERRRGGNKRYLSIAVEEEMFDELKNEIESGRIYTVSDIKTLYEKRIGKEVPDSTIYRMLHRHNWRKWMPKNVASKKRTIKT